MRILSNQIVIIAVNWDTIKRTFDDIKAYFMAKFARISGLIASTMDQAKKENQRTGVLLIIRNTLCIKSLQKN